MKKPIMPSEHSEQVALFKRVRFYRDTFPALHMVFAVPNGGHRNKIVASKLRAEGVESGIPDIFCDVAKNGYHGLRIELKKADGGKGLSQNQKLFRDRYQEHGFLFVEAHGYAQAWDCVCRYLGIDNPEKSVRERG